MNHIELFAGCGGMSLGLKSAGFDLLMANELSPMAVETFAYNFLEQSLDELPVNGSKHPSVYWLNSHHSDFTLRLRENPFEFPTLKEINNSDIPAEPSALKGKMIVGNIIHLNQLLKERKDILEFLRAGSSGEGVDLVSGGPPCQSFSLAGLRRRDCDKNTLPWEFANFVEMVKSKFVILENVTGILRAFKQDGESFHAWYEVSKVFAEKGYIPLCLHINARKIGIPQNRPRFIMIGVRDDILESLKNNLSDIEQALFAPGEKLVKDLKAKEKVHLSDFRYFDAHRDNDISIFENSFLRHVVGGKEVNVHEAIGDLQTQKPNRTSNYVTQLNKTFESILTSHSHSSSKQKYVNHELRNNGLHVRRRFRIYQVIQQLQKTSKSTAKELTNILKLNSDQLSDRAWGELEKIEFLQDNEVLAPFNTKNDLLNYLKSHPTKKRTQKALDKLAPAPAALSIPDDACHYEKNELRTLTVREMARIQSFPDNFVFKSKVTTGGRMRSYEVPQYTQVGNAVPPLLGVALGEIIKELLERSMKK